MCNTTGIRGPPECLSTLINGDGVEHTSINVRYEAEPLCTFSSVFERDFDSFFKINIIKKRGRLISFSVIDQHLMNSISNSNKLFYVFYTLVGINKFCARRIGLKRHKNLLKTKYFMLPEFDRKWQISHIIVKWMDTNISS